MKNNFLALLAVTAAVGLASPAFAADESANGTASVKYHDDGGYDASSKASQTTADGTSESYKNKASASVDSKGHVKKKVKHHGVTDPKGLGNKQTNDSEATLQQKDNGGYKTTSSKSIDDAAGTNTSSKTTKNVDVDASGNTTATETTKTTTDPKGLMNKETSTHTTKSVNGTVTEDTTK